jgi:hypothetical protein
MTQAPTERDLVDALDFLFAEKQGHCPSELYEDGYSDACADAKKAVKRLFHGQGDKEK